MQLFFFRFQCTPTTSSQQAGDIAGADIDVWVHSDCSLDEAEIRARGYVMDYAWVVSSMQLGRDWPLERIGELDTTGQALAQKAIREGISAFFLAWPKKDGRDGDPVELRSLGAPFFKASEP